MSCPQKLKEKKKKVSSTIFGQKDVEDMGAAQQLVEGYQRDEVIHVRNEGKMQDQQLQPGVKERTGDQESRGTAARIYS